MKIKTYILIFHLAMLCVSFINAQESYTINNDTLKLRKQFSFKTLSINEGLSQNSVISIAQDSIGYLWMATQDGLNKYNGRYFTYYDKQFEDITRSTFSKLGKVYIDKQNRLWIISHSGKLELYRNESDDFEHIKLPFDASSIYQDKNLNLFIGSYNNGLLKIDYKTKDTIQLLNSKNITVYDFLEIDNKLIISTSGHVFNYTNSNTIEEIPIEAIVKSNYSCIGKTESKTIWLGTYGDGLYYKPLNQSSFIKFTNDKLPTNLNIEDLLIDSNDRLWLATYGNGVYLIDFKSNSINNFLANKNNPFAIHYNDMLSLFEDTTGTIWLGSDGTGASYYDTHLIKFNILTNNQVPKSVNVDMVRCLTTDSNNNLWIGTSGKGLTHVNLKKESYKTFTKENSKLASNRIISLNYNNDELWIGHQGYGLNILDSKENYRFYPKISNYTIWKIVYENPEKRWLCTERYGVILFDKNKGVIKEYNTGNSKLESNNIRTLIKENDSLLWVGTDDSGLFKINLTTNTVSKINKVSDKIKSLFINKNNLWIGTNGNGLKKYNTNTKSVLQYTTDDGLPNNVVYGILPDNNGNLWLSTNNGLSEFKPNNISNKFENHSVYDGLQATEFNTGAYFKNNDGTLFFGGLEGVNWFNPEQLTFNPVKPKTIISKFEIFGKEQVLFEDLLLKHKDNTITFTFSSLHFSQPERNLYKYQLVNHDTEWIASGNNNVAHYTNLPPNDYTFKVISSNYDGVWNNEPALFSFTINKPWHLNRLAIVSYIILFLILNYSIYKYFKWRWQIKTQLQIEHTETERLKNLDEFKSKLFANISHEFRTPLTLILGPIERQLSDKNITKEKKEDLTLISLNAKRLLNLVDQLIDLTKLETGYLKLNVEIGDFSTLIHQLISAFKYQIKEKEIDLKTKIDTISSAWFDRDIIEKIIVNLLANAVKYTPEKGFINFSAHLQDEYVVITIINNGSTIKSDQINNLFTRFYQVNPNADGVGIGLALVKELVTLTNGSLIANTINKDELQFTVSIPIDKKAFKEEDIIEPNKISNTLEHQNESIIANTNVENEELTYTKKPIVLVVEDNEQLRHYIKSILDPKYKIIVSVNGKKGLKKALNKIPDLIVSDIMMPEMNGIELCNTLKNNTLTSHIPVILLTAKTGESNELEGLEVGADDFISKPFNSKILVKRIENLINFSKSLQKRYSQHTSIRPKDIAITNLDESFLSQIEDVLKEHLSEPDFNAQTFSELMTMSRMQLHRKLMALTGLSTTQFIRSQRLKLSTKLLQESDLTVSEIAYQVGFNTASYFIKCFKEAYNCTPNGYIPKD